MKKKKMLLLILMMTMGIVVVKGNFSQAALQSNGGSPTAKNINDWMMGIRQMQATGGTLGLTDTINGANLTSGNKNLDIHMQKNTEYGAMVILSASSYGNPNPITDGQTTTGNETGVKMKINKEWVAAGANDMLNLVTNFKNALNRYKNVYTLSNSSAKVGDATVETNGWHGGGATAWIGSNSPYGSGFVRSYSSSIFSYYGVGYGASGAQNEAFSYRTWSSRAVVVVGAGI